MKGGASGQRRPSLPLPALACDAHCHVFGPASLFPYAPDRRYTPEDAPKDALIALHERLGFQRAVVVQASCHGADNTAMVDCLRHDPVRFRGVAIIDGAANDGLLAQLHNAGVRGVRFNFVRHLGGAPDPSMFERALAMIAGLGWHVVLHLDAPDIADLSPMIADLKVVTVIDHMGRAPAGDGVIQEPFQALLKLLRHEHVWVKVSGAERIADPPFRSAVPFARALIAAAPDRVLWGTDFPHPNLKHEVDEADLVDLLADYGEAADLRRLLVTNPARLYDFPLPSVDA